VLSLGDLSSAVLDYLDPPNSRVLARVDFNFTHEIGQSALAIVTYRGRINVGVNHHLNPRFTRIARAAFKHHVHYMLV
jgi:hypothetical protein